jgi:hypothetical protein
MKKKTNETSNKDTDQSICFSNFWIEPIHKWLKLLRNSLVQPEMATNLNVLSSLSEFEIVASRQSLEKTDQRSRIDGL